MQEIKSRMDGGNTFWTTQDGQRESLKAALQAACLGRFTPEPRTPASAMKAACESVLHREGDRAYLVRALAEGRGFALVAETKGTGANEYAQDGRALLDENGTAQIEHPRALEIEAAYARERTILTGSQVGHTLVKVVAHLMGITLRPSGGIYWLPASGLENWATLAGQLEARGLASVYLMRHPFDADSLRAVRDAFIREIGEETNRIAGEIEGGELGERGLRTRQGDAINLRAKIKAYEAILSTGLESLTEKVTRIETAAASAIVQATAEEFAKAS